MEAKQEREAEDKQRQKEKDALPYGANINSVEIKSTTSKHAKRRANKKARAEAAMADANSERNPNNQDN